MRIQFLPSILLWQASLVFASLVGRELNEAEFNPQDVIKRDVVIVGGGSAGTYTAIQLHDAGKSVVVVEKQSLLGGHTDTYIDPANGDPINVGVQIFHDLEIVQNYFARLGVPLAKRNASALGPSIYADFKTGKPSDYVRPTAEQQGVAFGKYAQIIAANFSYLEEGFFLPDPVPEELLMPFGEFAAKYGLDAIVLTLNLFNQEGELWTQPTIYVIKQFGLALTQAIAKGLVATPDVQVLYDNAAKELGHENILYNAKIVATERSDSGVKVLVRTAQGNKLIVADKLLMTGAPMIDNFCGWDLNEEEDSIFRKFSALSYNDAIIKSPKLNASTGWVNVSPDTPYNLPRLPGIFGINSYGQAHPDLHSVYFGATQPVSVEFARAEILASLQRLTAAGVLDAEGTEIVALFNHTPFRLFVPVEDIKNGFYAKLYGLQGKRSTWWGGATFAVHDSALIWKFTEKFLLPALLS